MEARGAVATLGKDESKVVAPFSYFIHESAENLAFRAQGNFDYDAAHGAAIKREGQIRNDLKIGGGWAGAEVGISKPKKK